MAWVVERTALLEKVRGLALVSAAAPAAQSDLFKSTLLDFNGTTIELQAFNSIMGMKASVTCQVDGPADAKGQFVVQTKLLDHVLSKSSKRDIKFEIGERPGHWIIRASGAYKFVSYPPEQFTRMDYVSADAPVFWEGRLGEFVHPFLVMRKLASRVAGVGSNLFGGIFWDGDFSVVGDSAKRIAVWHSHRDTLPQGLLLQSDLGDALSKMGKSPDETISLRVDKATVELDCGNGDVVVSRLYESEKYPNCKSLMIDLRKRCTSKIVVKKVPLERAIDRVIPFSDNGIIELKFTPGKLSVRGYNETSAAVETIQSDATFEKPAMISGDYLMDLLAVTTADTVKFYVGEDAATPFLFVPSDEPVALVAALAPYTMKAA